MKTSSPFPASCQLFNASSVTAVVNAISSRSVFNVCYNPRLIKFIKFLLVKMDLLRKFFLSCSSHPSHTCYYIGKLNK